MMNFQIRTNQHLIPEALIEFFDPLLPEQGSLEVQRDQPYKHHDWHCHHTDETLIILNGSLTFYCLGQEFECSSNQIIHLPRLLEHASRAHAKGAIYLIAKEALWIS